MNLNARACVFYYYYRFVSSHTQRAICIWIDVEGLAFRLYTTSSTTSPFFSHFYSFIPLLRPSVRPWTESAAAKVDTKLDLFNHRLIANHQSGRIIRLPFGRIPAGMKSGLVRSDQPTRTRWRQANEYPDIYKQGRKGQDEPGSAAKWHRWMYGYHFCTAAQFESSRTRAAAAEDVDDSNDDERSCDIGRRRRRRKKKDVPWITTQTADGGWQNWSTNFAREKGFNSFVWNVVKKILNLIIEATFLAYKKPAMKLEGQKRATAIYRQRGKNCGRLLICQRHSVASIKSVDHKLVGLSFGLPGALCETAATPPVWSRAGRPPNENHQWRRATSSCHSFIRCYLLVG